MGTNHPKVVITGIGLVTPLGQTTTDAVDSLRGVSGIGPITQFDTSGHPVTIAGEVGDFITLTWVGQ